MKYGQRITWFSFNGSFQSVEVSGCDTQEEATRKAVGFATDSGWTYPKWWQWWRMHDTRPEMK